MNSAHPPGAIRAVWIIGRLALRRQLNVMTSFRFGRKKSGTSEASRSGTPAKSTGRSIVGGVVFVFMLIGGFSTGARGISGISAASLNTVRHGDKVVVSSFVYQELVEADDVLKQIRQDPDSAERGKYEAMWNHYVEGVLSTETRLSPLTEEEERASLNEMRALFDK